MLVLSHKNLSLFIAFAILAFSSGCVKKGPAATTPQKNSVKAQKNSEPNQASFCALTVEYSEGDTIKTKTLFATNCGAVTTIKALSTACKNSDAPTKATCSPKIADGDYACVDHSMFAPGMVRKGNWECRMEYSVGDTKKTLVEKASESDVAVDYAFQSCANVKEKDESKTAATREACARAMVERKMVCKNLEDAGKATPDQAPATPTNPRRKVSR
jgi:hypothetical protein